MERPPITLNEEAVWQARLDLAACFRAAARLGLAEGICNHFSAMVPGSDTLFLVNPDGWAFAEITASRLLICDFQGRVVAGEGRPEDAAFFIHARLHQRLPRARAAFHTHMPHATALAMLEGPPFSWSLQSSLLFHGRVAVDDTYNGVALDESEGDRIAASLGNADIMFMKNHGVLVTGTGIAEAWDDLYYLERAAQAEVLALSTGRKLRPVPLNVIARTVGQIRQGVRPGARLHLDSIRRQLDREAPGYRE